MANEDKFENKVDEASGKAKETAGRLSGEEDLRREGEAEKDKAQLKDKVQDAAQKVKDVFKK